MLLQRNAMNVCATRRRPFDMCLATSLKTVISPDQQDCPFGSSEQMKYTTKANPCLTFALCTHPARDEAALNLIVKAHRLQRLDRDLNWGMRFIIWSAIDALWVLIPV